MKILSSSCIVLLVLCAILAVAFAHSLPSMPNTAEMHQKAKLDRIKRRAGKQNRHGKFMHARNEDTQKCIDDISNAAGQIGGAVVEVIRAVADCPKKDNGAQCVADIGKVATYLTQAAADISTAVTDCSNGGAGSPCATDLIELGNALTAASTDVAQALADCEMQQDEGCIVELADASKEVEAIFTQIKKALTDCK